MPPKKTTAAEKVNLFLGKGRHEPLEITVTSSSPKNVLYLCNIPCFLTVSEFLQQCEPFFDQILKVTVCSPAQQNDTYSALVVLATEGAAQELRSEFNQKPISALAKEALLVYYVCTVDTSGTPLLPAEVLPPVPAGGGAAGSTSSTTAVPQQRELQQTPNTGAQADPTNQCSICLEPLSSEAEVTTVCGHNFHIACFVKVQDDHCPLCRYNPNAEHDAHCNDCSNTDDLWMCLVCGAVQCGRYSSGHAIKHFQSTQHGMAVEVGGFRVWDYAQDAFVHRLVSLEDTASNANADNTTTSTGTTAWWALGDEEEAELEAAKLESKTDFIAEFYSQILMHQLQQQQQYFEGQLATLATQNAFSSILGEEEAQRRTLVGVCVQEYKSIAATFKSHLNHSREMKRSKMKHAKEELEALEVNINSLREGRGKCEQLLKTMKERQAKARLSLKPQQEEAERLEAELMEIYSKFA